MKKKIFTANAVVLPWPSKQCNFTSVTADAVLPADDLADSNVFNIMFNVLSKIN